jgi:RNA polymerase sigma-70 factor (ECF subfamily)
MDATMNTTGRFEKLMKRTYKKVYNMAYRLSGNAADAEDLTQEAFFRAFRSFDSYEGDKPFENWILRIVSRLFLDLLRHRRRRVSTVSYDAPLHKESAEEDLLFEKADSAPSPEDELLNHTLSEELEDTLRSLPAEQRLVVMLADVDDMPYQDIAEMLGAPIGTIRSRLHRTHKALRKKIVEWEFRHPAKDAASRLCISD